MRQDAGGVREWGDGHDSRAASRPPKADTRGEPKRGGLPVPRPVRQTGGQVQKGATTSRSQSRDEGLARSPFFSSTCNQYAIDPKEQRFCSSQGFIDIRPGTSSQ